MVCHYGHTARAAHRTRTSATRFLMAGPLATLRRLLASFACRLDFWSGHPWNFDLANLEDRVRVSELMRSEGTSDDIRFYVGPEELVCVVTVVFADGRPAPPGSVAARPCVDIAPCSLALNDRYRCVFGVLATHRMLAWPVAALQPRAHRPANSGPRLRRRCGRWHR